MWLDDLDPDTVEAYERIVNSMGFKKQVPRTKEQMVETLGTILAIWETMPELRLSQLIANAVGHGRQDAGLPAKDDIFYIEDSDLLLYLEQFKKKMNR